MLLGCKTTTNKQTNKHIFIYKPCALYTRIILTQHIYMCIYTYTTKATSTNAHIYTITYTQSYIYIYIYIHTHLDPLMRHSAGAAICPSEAELQPVTVRLTSLPTTEISRRQICQDGFAHYSESMEMACYQPMPAGCFQQYHRRPSRGTSGSSSLSREN